MTTIDPSAAVEPAVKLTDKLWALRTKRFGWLITFASVVIVILAGGWGIRYGWTWVTGVNAHVAIHAPEAVRRFEALERKVDKLAEDVGEMKGDMRTVRDGLIRRGMADAPTPTAAPVRMAAAPAPFRFFELVAGAEASDGPGGGDIRPLLPAVSGPAGAGHQVAKER